MDSQQPPPPLPHASTTAHGRALENLKSLVMKCAIASAPTKSLSLQRKTFIKRRIQELFPTTIHTPHHPPYAWMIENAIKQLNEEGGWDEEAISKFILAEYKDLPWPHAALLKHHLQRLSETAHLTRTHHGCYFIGRPTLTKPNLRITCTTSRSRSPSPSPTPVSSSSPTYDTSSSSQSFYLKKKKKKRNCRKKIQRQKQNARGMGIHPKYKEGRDRARACARGRGRGRDGSSGNPCNEEMKKEVCCGQVGGDMCVDGMRVVEILSLLMKDEATDEDIQRKQVPQEEANEDCVDLESQEQPIMVIGIEALQCEYGINKARIEPLQQNMGTIPSSHGRKLASEEGSKRIRPQRRNSHSRNNNKSQSGMRRGRSRKRETGNNMNLVEVKLMEGETQYVNGVEQEEGRMDALIDEVYIQLTEPTELLSLTIDGEAAEGNLETNMKQEIVNVGIETGDVTEMQNKMIPQTHVIYDDECKISDDLNEQESKFGKVVEKQKHLKEEQGVCIEEQNQCGKARPTRPRRNKSSTNVADADRSKSSSTAARPALRRRRK